MRKSKKIGLKLRKRTISNFKTIQLRGGSSHAPTTVPHPASQDPCSGSVEQPKESKNCK